MVTSAAELWNLNLLTSQSVVAVGAALVAETDGYEFVRSYFLRQFAIVEDSDLEDVEIKWRRQIKLNVDTSNSHIFRNAG